ncbi:MAG: tRNA pseudouridine(38-40) synthase TruA [Nitrosomonas sp.]|nr:tRNA pseudouridine(38-40) synthase TruA [Nitrosomonas sp.]
MKIALVLEYDGRGYCGWQKQSARPSIQSELESALSRIACQPILTVAAGRTDAGVHALYQVVHFETEVIRPMTAWVRGVNALLSPTLSVLWAKEISHNFHARFSAIGRTYRYYLLNRPVRPGILKGKVGWIHDPLDLRLMQAAARLLVGIHDFSAFRSAECQAKNAVRQIYKLEITQQGQLLIFELRANAFLQHMVRNIVGSLVYVGKRRYPVEWIQMVLTGRDRALAAPTFSPDGLYLAGVHYPDTWHLPAIDAFFI